MDTAVPNTFKMSLHFQQSTECMLIHPSYFENIADFTKEEWHYWLKEFGISTKPKLIKQRQDVSALAAKHEPEYCLHPLFQQLVDLPNSMIWLTLLRDEWTTYKEFYKLLPRNCLQQALVTCQNGSRKPLDKVYWATHEVTKEPLAMLGLNLLHVGDFSRPWRELDVLGYKRKPDLDFYLMLLRKTARGEIPGVIFSDVIRLMQGIELHAKNNESIIRQV